MAVEQGDAVPTAAGAMDRAGYRDSDGVDVVVEGVGAAASVAGSMGPRDSLDRGDCLLHYQGLAYCHCRDLAGYLGYRG